METGESGLNEKDLGLNKAEKDEEHSEIVRKLLSDTIDSASTRLDNIKSENISEEQWWNDKNISLAEKVLMKEIQDNPSFKDESKKDTDFATPLFIVPGESKLKDGKKVNIVISTKDFLWRRPNEKNI